MNDTWSAAVAAAARWNARENAGRRYRVVSRRRPDGSIYYTCRPGDAPEMAGYALGTRGAGPGWEYQRER